MLFRLASVPPTLQKVLGGLSRIIYRCYSSCRVKYIAIVLRADNQVEGGIVALTALHPSRLAIDRDGRPRPDGHRPRGAALR